MNDKCQPFLKFSVATNTYWQNKLVGVSAYPVLKAEYLFLSICIFSFVQSIILSFREKRLSKKYYDKLFKEYCIADLRNYKENKVIFKVLAKGFEDNFSSLANCFREWDNIEGCCTEALLLWPVHESHIFEDT